jgi:hypothetical protein
MRVALFPVTITGVQLSVWPIFVGGEHQLVLSLIIRMRPNMRRDFALLRQLDHVHRWLVSLREWQRTPGGVAAALIVDPGRPVG